ncbi:hypothetical protein C3747_52g203 [Trypanosoma cruzi]|uniref:Uncharacterized protein n=2 Tax=Trypanosoma cruzi TaxID=5693 RepID=Q4D2D3_TRYCC|nr:hypothetical protein, conserved [Trypanosoma cruzi]EAN86684.1 hypothetical protein, conserved [Trypanosoma cruzi]PWV12349.1 hypothetical protein C3747_52g203 [Trypanosoma cruzi]RNC41716.1 hypothetical protein TcCL_NonESM08703 [Trypanosoma cruzi]|eukprot:XP_808535.1 hypothetical protein [Trypanosoma cruzi strain CL Brener]
MYPAAASTTRRFTVSDEREECDDALEHIGLTVTRRTWATQLVGAQKHVVQPGVGGHKKSDQRRRSSSSSRSDAQMGNGLTATMTSGSTPPHSTQTARASPMKTHGRRQNREISIDLVWGERDDNDEEKEEKEEECVHVLRATPATVLTRASRPPERNDASSPALVRRCLSLHEDGRRSGTVAKKAMAANQPQQTPSPAAARVSVATPTPTPWNRMPPLLPVRDPPTESRELSMRPGYTLPSPSTPLWTALEEEEDEEEGGAVVDLLRDDAIVRLPLGRRPLSLAHHASSLPLAVTREVTDNSEDGRQLHGSEGRRSAPAFQKSQRQAEEAARKARADAWAEEMRNFFERIEERPLLTVTMDEQP